MSIKIDCFKSKVWCRDCCISLRQYLLTEIHDDEALQVVTENVLNNEPFAEKIPVGNTPSPVAFFIKNVGKGKKLFENLDEVFKENEIFVGVDLTAGFF